jgi:hypothetical protein
MILGFMEHVWEQTQLIFGLKNDIFVYFHSNEKAVRGYYSGHLSVASQKLPESRGLGTWIG